MQRGAERGARDRDLEVVGPVARRRSRSPCAAARARPRRGGRARTGSRASWPRSAAVSGWAAPSDVGVQLERAARLALGRLEVAAAVREAAEVVVQRGDRRPATRPPARRSRAPARSARRRRRTCPMNFPTMPSMLCSAAGVGVVGAERRLAALERARQHVAGAGAVARVEQGEAAQAAELDVQPVERVAGGQRGRERVGAIERARGVGVIAERRAAPRRAARSMFGASKLGSPCSARNAAAASPASAAARGRRSRSAKACSASCSPMGCVSAGRGPRRGS